MHTWAIFSLSITHFIPWLLLTRFTYFLLKKDSIGIEEVFLCAYNITNRLIIGLTNIFIDIHIFLFDQLSVI